MFGKHPSDKRLQIIKPSKNYKNGAFQNQQATTITGNLVKALWRFVFQSRAPAKNIPAIKTNLFALDANDDVLIWFGHSSYLIQIEHKKILVDPVFSDSPSPLPFLMTAFKGTNIYTADDIPDGIDYLIITHDHWDHLDYNTVTKLKNKVGKVICPLGVGEHLEYWGFASNDIIEMDWNDEVALNNDNFKITCLPSQHFSGRGLARNKSLWASFLIETPNMFRIFVGCDGGYNSHFADIGRKFNNIDLAILENGQYNESWKSIHMYPRYVAQAAVDLKAKSLLPVHVAKFNLSTHYWNEPLEKISKFSANKAFKLITPMIGEKVYLKNSKQTFTKWW